MSSNPLRRLPVAIITSLGITLMVACSPASPARTAGPAVSPGQRPARADDLLVVDCLLPGQIRRLGRQVTTLTARRAVKTSARDCEIRGGEYVAWDRANYKTALKVWTPLATEGDPVAQTYVGEIYEKGLGVAPDYARAAEWYRRAAEGGSSRAAVNLGYLYEEGLGVPRDAAQAAHWYRKATGAATASLVIDAASRTGESGGSTRSRSGQQDVGPRIRLTEPALPAASPGGVPELRVQPPIDRLTLAGQVTTTGTIRTFTVNGAEHRLGADRRFHVQVALPAPDERVKLVAVDQSGRRADMEFLVKSPPPARPGRRADVPASLGLARYHALVIGNDDYRLLPRLTGAVAGARDIATTLRDAYEFEVTLLTNASRYDVLLALNDQRQQLTDRDSLLIFYTGRGEAAPDGRLAYWLPVDAEPRNPGTWVSSQVLTEFFSSMEVRQILVATDSCYAGTLGRGSLVSAGGDERMRVALIENLASRRSRMVMASSSCDRAPEVASGPSPFTRSLAEILQANQEVLSGQELFQMVRVRLAAVERPQATEALQYAPIRHAGHEGGDFVFVRAVRN